MEVLARNPLALPLNNNTDTTRHNHHFMYAHDTDGEEFGDTSRVNMDAWDAETFYGCVCDSSWVHGLGANQTNAPEWFGPDCSLRVSSQAQWHSFTGHGLCHSFVGGLDA